MQTQSQKIDQFILPLAEHDW